jgi:branched-chain amino acid transport system permease protein
VYLVSEWLRDFGNIQMIVFAFAVIIFARFFRTGLWGLATAWRTRPSGRNPVSQVSEKTAGEAP